MSSFSEVVSVATKTCEKCGAKVTIRRRKCGCVTVNSTATGPGGHRLECDLVPTINLFSSKRSCQEHSGALGALFGRGQ